MIGEAKCRAKSDRTAADDDDLGALRILAVDELRYPRFVSFRGERVSVKFGVHVRASADQCGSTPARRRPQM